LLRNVDGRGGEGRAALDQHHRRAQGYALGQLGRARQRLSRGHPWHHFLIFTMKPRRGFEDMHKRHLRLGVNIDHVATIRNARGGRHPDPVRAARLAAQAGADGITAHLREDRRHISDDDIDRLARDIDLPLNLEMAATEEMLEIALRHRPNAACIVPEKRADRTTEGGLDAVNGHEHLLPYVRELSRSSIRVSLFVEPDPRQLDAAKSLGAPVVELHTGAYCEREGQARLKELERI